MLGGSLSQLTTAITRDILAARKTCSYSAVSTTAILTAIPTAIAFAVKKILKAGCFVSRRRLKVSNHSKMR